MFRTLMTAALATATWLTTGWWWLGPLAAAVGAGLAAYLVRSATRRLGGITGDVLGAAVELTAAGVLVVLAAG